MNKPLLSRALVVAAVVAVAGVAQAETFDSPTQAGEASTMTNGQPNIVTNNVPSWSTYGPLPAPVVNPSVIGVGPVVDTTVLGGPPSVTTYETTTIYPSNVYVQPSTGWGYYEMHPRISSNMGGASATSPVPDRAGELSNIVNGVPNAMP